MRRSLSLDNKRPMIVKVQRSLFSSTGTDTVLVYDKNRTITEVLPITKELTRKLGGSYKRYFHAEMRHGQLVLGCPAADQNW